MTETDMDPVRRCELAEIRAWASAWEAPPASVGERLGLSLRRDGMATVFQATGAPVWSFNRIVGLGLDRPAERDWVDAQLHRFVESGAPHGVGLCPAARPAEIPAWLEERGLRRTTVLAKMMRSTDDPPTGGGDVTIRPVGREDADRFAHAATRGFGMPEVFGEWFASLPGRRGWRLYLALHAGEAVGTGAFFVSGEVAWLGFGSTVPEHRGRGVHRAVMARRMRDAADLGCRWLCTETNLAEGDEPTPSLNNMKRLGFELAYARPNYVRDPGEAVT